MNFHMNTRREFFSQVILASGAAGILAACKTSSPALLNCEDASALSDADKAMRTTLKYVDKSTDPAKICSGCNFFQKPSQENACGGCTLVKGPINPGGLCSSWVQKAA